MEPRVLGWPPDGPALRLDHERFRYAGKFVMTSTGKAVLREPDAGTPDDPEDPAFDDTVLAAIAFNEDRTEPGTLWLRYVTVRDDRRGEGLGPRLCAFVVERAADRGYDRVRIAVNNPFAYEALYRAGFTYTGRETGIAELVLERPTDAPAERSPSDYRAGLERFRDRDLPAAVAEFLAARPPETAGPPPVDASPAARD